MKICFLGDIESVHLQRWVKFFKDKKHEVSIISFNRFDIEGVDIHYVGDSIDINSSGGNAKYLKKLKYIKKIIKQINPDVINAHYLTSYGFIASLIKDRPLIVSTWGSDILVTPNRGFIYKKLTKYVISKSDLLTSDSNYMSEKIIELGGKEEKVITAPMGIDTKEFNIEGRDNKNKYFLSMRTLCKNSNIEVIIKAFAKVVKVDKEAKLIITNSGNSKEKILKLIHDLKIDSNVEYLGFVSRNKVKDLLKKCRGYISIPTSDSTSVTLLEAMACGTMPIVSDIPANKEWINEENGYMLKEVNEEHLYNAMIELINNNDLFMKAQKKNLDIISNRAIWENNMNEILKSYENIIIK